MLKSGFITLLTLFAMTTGRSVHAGEVGQEQETTPQDINRQEDLLGKREKKERELEKNTFALTAYKQNYLLPVTYNSNANQQHELLDNWEIKFQLSVKVPLVIDPFGIPGEFSVAYTQKNFWQAYNKEISSPFRETNYEPEMFWNFNQKATVLGMKFHYVGIGFVHQSNGRGQRLSRSWNRIYANFVFQKGDFYMSLKPWYRIPEAAKSSPDDPGGDDNPDIIDYMGHGEFKAFYKYRKNEFSMMLRNIIGSPYRGAVQIDWAYPMTKQLKWYVQYFNGYGESLIDYNFSVNRLGVGIMLSNWL